MSKLEKVAVLAVGVLVVVVITQFFMVGRMPAQVVSPASLPQLANEKIVSTEKVAPASNSAGEPAAVAERPESPEVPAVAEPLPYVAPPTAEETKKYTESMTHPTD